MTNDIERVILENTVEQLRAKVTQRDKLIHRIFETTVPYNEKGEYIFCESVLNEWKELYEL